MRHDTDAQDSPYDYSSMVAAADAVLRTLKNRVLERSLVQVVHPEFNVFYLVFADGSLAIHGRVGGEVLAIAPVDTPPTPGRTSDTTTVVAFPAFDQFAGRRIAAARTVGSAWNGHGFEFSFDGIYDRTMIVQSIYTGAEPPDRFDCLRLGVGFYHSEWPPDGGAAQPADAAGRRR